MMVKICDGSFGELLKLTFRYDLESGKFPREWKKVNVFPVHQKLDKQNLRLTDQFHYFLLLGKA